MDALFGLILFLAIFMIYFLPALVAGRRRHKNTTPIFLVNLFFGWTLLGWLFALIWATTSNVAEVRAS